MHYSKDGICLRYIFEEECSFEKNRKGKWNETKELMNKKIRPWKWKKSGIVSASGDLVRKQHSGVTTSKLCPWKLRTRIRNVCLCYNLCPLFVIVIMSRQRSFVWILGLIMWSFVMCMSLIHDFHLDPYDWYGCHL